MRISHRPSECSISGWAKSVRDGVRLSVKVTPKARRTALGPVEEGADGPRLKISVTAPPDRGKANAALCQLIGRELGVAKSRVSVVSGAHSRLKEIEILGDSRELLAKARRRLVRASGE